jgi:peptidoglycan hydrolase CwlO-like protein
MKELDVNKLTQWIGIITIAITTVITFNNLFNTVRDHEARLLKIEKTEEQLTQLQKSIDYATWRIDSLSKDFDKITTVTKGTKR